MHWNPPTSIFDFKNLLRFLTLAINKKGNGRESGKRRREGRAKGRERGWKGEGRKGRRRARARGRGRKTGRPSNTHWRRNSSSHIPTPLCSTVQTPYRCELIVLSLSTFVEIVALRFVNFELFFWVKLRDPFGWDSHQHRDQHRHVPEEDRDRDRQNTVSTGLETETKSPNQHNSVLYQCWSESRYFATLSVEKNTAIYRD